MSRFGKPYSKDENDLLLGELQKADNHIKRENLKCMADLWPGFFKGVVRTQKGLYEQTKRLAKENKITYIIDSGPEQDRSNWKKSPTMLKPKQKRLKEQILVIVQQEIRLGIQRATAKILNLIESISDENIEIKEELRKLRPYQQIVETNYGKELSLRGGK